jgi:hypothetical protein
MFKYYISRLLSKFCLFLVKRELLIWNLKSGIYTYLENYCVLCINTRGRDNAVGLMIR